MFEDSCSWLSSNPELTSSWCSVVSWCCVVIVWACSKEGSEAWQQSAAGTTGVTLSFCLANLAWLYMHACNCVIVYAYATQWPCMCALSLLLSPFNEKKAQSWKTWPKACNGSLVLHGPASSHSCMPSVCFSFTPWFESLWYCYIKYTQSAHLSIYFPVLIFCYLYPHCPWPWHTSLSVCCLSFPSLSPLTVRRIKNAKRHKESAE